MKKTIRLTESELIKLVKRVVSEQFNDRFVDNYSTEMENDSDNWKDIGDKMDMRNNEITKNQLKDIIMNFSRIDCSNVNAFDGENLTSEIPERDIIYCQYYKGKSRADLMRKYKSL